MHKLTAALLILALPACAAAQQSGSSKSTRTKKSTAAAAAPTNPYDAPQPAVENLDLNMYAQIRAEGFQHSHVMDYAGGLADGIGPRLTGSPNMAKANAWTRDQLAQMGCANAHLESWGDFGMGWRQNNTWVRMTAPDTAIFNAQATPWSPSSNGPVTGEAISVIINDASDMEKYKGKLAGKVVFFGEMREVGPLDKPLFRRYDDKELADLAKYEIGGGQQSADAARRMQQRLKQYAFRDKVAQFFADEHAAAVIVPSRDAPLNGGTGIFFDDNGAALGRTPYKKDTMVKVPVVVAEIENYGRVYRLLDHKVPVTIELNVDTTFTGDNEQGFDTIAEIPGTDPALKDQVVMVGGHLDSWISGTGATDNGAGAVVAMEVMRILNSLGVKPRRTIRIGLWSGEEEGLFGSRGYVKNHFGSFPPSTDPAQLALPEFMRRPGGPLDVKPEQKLLSVYFNVDNGTGMARGIYTQENSAVVPIFEQWIAPLHDLGVTTITTRNTGGTDHLSFDAVNIPGFQFIQDPMDYETRTHHSNMDTYEHLSPNDLKQLAVVEAIFVYNAAMRDQMMPRKPFPHPERNEQLNAPIKNLYPVAMDAQFPAPSGTPAAGQPAQSSTPATH
jgi:carboxypeptidase Q